MAHTVASCSAAASHDKFYHVFINHCSPDVRKTLSSQLYHRLCSAHIGLRVFLDQPEISRSQIKDVIRTTSVHVAIFSPRYAMSKRCLNELLYMLDSEVVIIPVFYHIEPSKLRWTQGRGDYADALRILENKKRHDPQTQEEKPRHDPATIKKWRKALSSVSEISGLNLESCNRDEGDLVEKIVERVLEETKTISGFYCSKLFGCYEGSYRDDGTYSGIRRITVTTRNNWLTSVQLYYGLEGNENLKERFFPGHRHGSGSGSGDKIEFDLNYPEEIVTKISGNKGGLYAHHPAIASLTFHTNQRKLGPCGQEKGPSFETEVEGKIVGVFGFSGALVHSIGVHMLKPRSLKNEEFYCSRVYGGPGGGYCSDGTHLGIRRITMTTNSYSLTSLQLHYALEGDRYFPGCLYGGVTGIPHLGALGDKIQYNLNYPEEILTKISGHYGSYKSPPESWIVIKSLTFHTNRGKYGPCGQECGTRFETEETGKIVGVFGFCGTLVDSIGVYMLRSRTLKGESL